MNIPVIVSFGATAASGGYFIAAPATKIVAEPGTITGSIGVFAGKPVLTQMWRKLKINFEGVQAGAAADTDSVNSDYSAEAWARQEARLDAIYADFIGKVAAGRNLTPEKVEEAAKGQIWSGADAKAHGLVDELGGLAMAIKLGQAGSQARAGNRVALVTYPPAASAGKPDRRIHERGHQPPRCRRPRSMRRRLLPRRRAGSSARCAPLIEQPDASSLWSPPITVNGRFE